MSDEHIKRAAEDMIRRHGSEATAKAEEYIEGLNSERLYALAKRLEVIRDKIRELQEDQHLCQAIGRGRHQI